MLDDYTVSFILAGIPPIFGAFFMCFIHRIKTEEVQQQNSPVHLESSTSKTMIASATVTTNLSTNMEEKAQESESLLVKNGKFVNTTTVPCCCLLETQSNRITTREKRQIMNLNIQHLLIFSKHIKH